MTYPEHSVYRYNLKFKIQAFGRYFFSTFPSSCTIFHCNCNICFLTVTNPKNNLPKCSCYAKYFLFQNNSVSCISQVHTSTCTYIHLQMCLNVVSGCLTYKECIKLSSNVNFVKHGLGHKFHFVKHYDGALPALIDHTDSKSCTTYM